MKSCSSTSASRNLGRAYPAAFFAFVFAAFGLANETLLHSYARVEGRVFGLEWAQKKGSYEAQSLVRPVAVAYVGDSTVDVGVRMDLVARDGFNLGRSGLDPSRLPGIARWLLADPGRTPRVVLLTLAASHLGENAYAEPLALPSWTAASDALRLYYAESSSFKPVLCGGCGYLTALADKGLERFKSRFGGAPAAPPWRQESPRSDPKLLVREANFSLIQDFKRTLASAGVRVIWVSLPMRASLAHKIDVAPTSRDFAVYERRRLSEIFGSDLIDLAPLLPDDEFLDDVHADPAGAEVQSRELGRRLTAILTAETQRHKGRKATQRTD